VKFAEKVAVILLACGFFQSCLAADQYWGYQYKQFSVTAQGDAEFARNLAHNLYRLDLSIAAVLQSKGSQWRPHIDVYAVPGELFAAFSGQPIGSGSLSKVTPLSSTFLINTSQSPEDRYWSTYFAFGTSVLGTTYSYRYPPWFTGGLAEVFAASVVEKKKVTIGGINKGRVYTLNSGTWIPIQTLLSVRRGDPQMSSRVFVDMYSAETWYLVHKIVIDQFYHSNFYQYFVALDHGEDEQKAFAVSFDMSYEALDMALKKSMTTDKFMRLTVTVPDDDDGVKPVRLNEAESKARLARYAAEYGVQPEKGLELASAALKLDPGNENAKIARLRAEARAGNPDAASRDADEVCTGTSLSSHATGACALVYRSLEGKVSDKSAQAVLRDKARKFYDQTVQLEPEDLRSWYGLSRLVLDTHDVADAKTFLPKFLAVQAEHPDAGILAGSVAALYYLTGDESNAMKYALVWQSRSISNDDRASAAAYISRLKDASDRKRAAAGISPTEVKP
jgi:tetratricopeptide (TPR) repeat protein